MTKTGFLHVKLLFSYSTLDLDIRLNFIQNMMLINRYALAMYNLLVIPEIVDYYFSLLSPFSCVLLPEIRLQKYLSLIGWRL